MAGFPRAVLFTTSVFLFWRAGSAVAQVLQPPASLYGGGHQLCNYQFAIPNGGNCVTYGPALEQKLSAVQQDVDRAKLQYVSQNTILREELRKLRQQASLTDVTVADLTRQFKNLQTTVVTLQTNVANGCCSNNNNNNNNGGNNSGVGGGGMSSSNALLQQLVTTTRTQLTSDVLQLENKINTAISVVQADRQRDAVQQAQVDKAFQDQLRKQQQDLSLAFQRIQQLQNSLNSLAQNTYPPPQSTPSPAPTTASTTTPTTTTTTAATTTTTTAGPVTQSPAMLALLSSLTQLAARVSQLESNNSLLQQQYKNQSLKLSSVEQEADYILNQQIPALDSRISTNNGFLVQVRHNLTNQLTPLESQVQKVAANVSALGGQVTALGTQTLNQNVKQSQDELDINDLKLQVRLLAGKLTALQSAAHITTPTPPTTTFAVPTPNPPNGGGQSTTSAFAIPTPARHNG